MQSRYKELSEIGDHDKVLGVHVAYMHFVPPKGQVPKKPLSIKKCRELFKLSPHTGIVLLSLENCGAGVVSHELMHAVFFAHNIQNNNQYPIKVKNMGEEENILRCHTLAVETFYDWYWRITEGKKIK